MPSDDEMPASPTVSNKAGPLIKLIAIFSIEHPSKLITVSINGTTRPLPDSAVVAALLEEMGLTGKRIALERNGEIVPRSMFATQHLADGDKLEVVIAVGGG